mmetsp:Transcript_13511/g.24849  ORF Transcript_13511/g.24849 Transcript_13511/m.24849 type:complete len:236 (-) Transcript_13511:58-765(-)
MSSKVSSHPAFQRQKFAWKTTAGEYTYNVIYEQVPPPAASGRGDFIDGVSLQASSTQDKVSLHSTILRGGPASRESWAVFLIPPSAGQAYATALLSAVSMIGTMISAKLKACTFLHLNETAADDKAKSLPIRDLPMYHAVLGLIRSCRLEAPNLLVSYVAVDMATWFHDRESLFRSLPDIHNSQLTELFYEKGIPKAPTLMPVKMDEDIEAFDHQSGVEGYSLATGYKPVARVEN